MNELTKYLVDGILNEVEEGVTVMLPGGFKPPHEGHFQLAKGYAEMPQVKEVVILVGPKDRDGITVEDSEAIWKMLIGGIPNIKVQRSKYPSPLLTAYKYIEEEAQPGGTYALGSSSKGSDYERIRGFVDGHQEGGKYFKEGVSVVELPIERSEPILYKGRTDDQNNQPMSASQLRADLAANDFENFKTNYPSINSPSQLQTIYDMLVKKKMKEGGQDYSQSTLDKQAIKESRLRKYIRKVIREINEAKGSLILEGGAAGHMAHPYEDTDLTFDDIENMIDAALSGKVEYAQEKLDGQNLMVTYKDGKVLSARNKTQLKNAAEKAMSKTDMEKSMEHLPDNVRNAFLDAMQDITDAIDKLTPAEKEQFFGNGTKFVNMELLHPASENVAAYGVTELRMHNVQEYDEAGNVVGTDSEAPKKIEQALDRVQASKQSTYDIRATDVVNLKQTEDYENQKKELSSALDQIRSKYRLKKGDKLGLYFQNSWSDYVKDNAKKYKYDIPDSVLQNIVNRWAFASKDPDLRAIKNTIDNPQFLEWFVNTDKGAGVRDQKKAIVEPVEDIFLRLGVFVLKSLQGLLAINPNASIAKMKDELASSIEQIKLKAANEKMSDDDAPMRFLKHQLKRLEKIGGFDAIMPTEGIVFKHNGKLYKLTGAFAPLNQIIGYIKFGR